MKLNAFVVVAVLAAGDKILDTVQADIDKAKSDPNAISRQVLCRWERTGPAVRTQGLRQVVG